MLLFHLASVLIAIAAAGAYVNHRFIRLPDSIGIMLSALVFSIGLMLLGSAGWVAVDRIERELARVHFGDLVLHGLLAFLLFAGALHVDLASLRSQRWPVLLLATLGVAVTAGATGLLLWLAAGWIGLSLGLMEALVFGTLIAPTDPIAVLAILKQAGVPAALETKITGESLFNDGVGVTLFILMVAIAAGEHIGGPSDVVVFLLREAGGGILLGLIVGYAANRLLCSIDAYAVEGLATLAAAMGGYSLSEVLELSAPICVVVAGLIVGNHGRARAMSEVTRERVDNFWELIDYVLNSLLFVLIGLEVLLLHFEWSLERGLIALAAIVIVLISRLAGVGLASLVVGVKAGIRRGSVLLLTWAGLKGGISIALALSLPDMPARDLLLWITYAVVVFSVLCQGLTVEPLARRLMRRRDVADDARASD